MGRGFPECYKSQLEGWQMEGSAFLTLDVLSNLKCWATWGDHYNEELIAL